MAQDLVNHVGKLDFSYFMPEGAVTNTNDSSHFPTWHGI